MQLGARMRLELQESCCSAATPLSSFCARAIPASTTSVMCFIVIFLLPYHAISCSLEHMFIFCYIWGKTAIWNWDTDMELGKGQQYFVSTSLQDLMPSQRISPPLSWFLCSAALSVRLKRRSRAASEDYDDAADYEAENEG